MLIIIVGAFGVRLFMIISVFKLPQLARKEKVLSLNVNFWLNGTLGVQLMMVEIILDQQISHPTHIGRIAYNGPRLGNVRFHSTSFILKIRMIS